MLCTLGEESGVEGVAREWVEGWGSLEGVGWGSWGDWPGEERKGVAALTHGCVCVQWHNTSSANIQPTHGGVGDLGGGLAILFSTTICVLTGGCVLHMNGSMEE